MVNKLFFIKLITSLFFVMSLSLHSFSQEKIDSIIQNSAVKFDLVPLYSDLFDNRVQIRFGAEYEKKISKKASLECYLDIGLYDKYIYIKYYNFFNPLYSIEQKVKIIGFHLLPGYNYYFYTSKKNPNRKYFAGAALDFGFYKKTLEYYNNQTSSGYPDNYYQLKLGVGLGLGLRNYVGKNIFFEFRTSMFTKGFSYISKDDRIAISSLDALWTSTNFKFWWISNLKIGYAF
jgi:hypothetical protein